jgi:hypothetical protein
MIISTPYCLLLNRNNVEMERERDRKKGRKKETAVYELRRNETYRKGEIK